MPGRTRAKTRPVDHDAQAFLQALIETPPDTRHGWHAPVTLRSTAEQHKHALRGYRLRSWVDRVLQHAERILAIAALLVFGYWLYDGPVRDWLYWQRTPITQSAPAAAPGSGAGGSRQSGTRSALAVAPLPYIGSGGADGSSSDFIAPRSAGNAQVRPTAPEPNRLQIPSIGVDTPVREVFVTDGVWEVADYAAGYMHGTALPGERGTMALAGHAGLRGGVFRDLGSIAVNDDVLIDAAGWRYRYRVREALEVWPTDTTVLEPTADATLVLITCTNWDTQRLIIRAELVESKPVAGS